MTYSDLLHAYKNQQNYPNWNLSTKRWQLFKINEHNINRLLERKSWYWAQGIIEQKKKKKNRESILQVLKK